MNVARTEPSASTRRSSSSTAHREPATGFHVRPVRTSSTSKPAPPTRPRSDAFANAQDSSGPVSGTMLPVRMARTFRTRAPTTPWPITRGWIVAMSAGTMKVVWIGSPGFAYPQPYDQETSTPFASRRITLMQTVRESGMSASGSVSHESSNVSPCFTGIRGQPFTHQSAPPVCRTSKAPSGRTASFTASFSRDHARRSLNAQAFVSSPAACSRHPTNIAHSSAIVSFLLFIMSIRLDEVRKKFVRRVKA